MNKKQKTDSRGIRKAIAFIMVFAILTGVILSVNGGVLAQQLTAGTTTYLPMVIKPAPRQVLLGTYTESYLGFQDTIDNEVKAIDTWSGKQLSLVGTFIAIEDPYPNSNIPGPLGKIWDNGYTPFVNLNTSKTLGDINSGSLDSNIRAMAQAFKAWRDTGISKGQNRKSYLAPLQEMNGDWVSYNGSPSDFKKAFQRIQDIFDQEGATPSVRWVFAPNGWSDTNQAPFEDYYPGDSKVEVVAFSSYNSGYCPSSLYKTWTDPETVFTSYIERFLAMAPSKPIFIAQTATSAYAQNGYSNQAKNDWLYDAYTLLAGSYGVKGIVYFNKEINQTCDWAFYQPSGSKFDGYAQAAKEEEFVYIAPEQLANMTLTP